MKRVRFVTFGEKMRALMAERGVSLRALAKTLPVDPGHLSRISRDLRPPSDEMAAQIDQALGADGELIVLARNSPARPALTPDDEERLLLAARRPVRIDPVVIQSLGTVLDAQRRIEDSVGSASLLEPVRAQVAAIACMVAGARGEVRVALLDIAAQWAQFAGWLHASLDRRAEALRHLGTALEWATEIDDRAMIGAVLSWRGHVAERAGEIGPMIGLSRAGQRTRDMGRVYNLFQEARGHAVLGDADAVERLTATAREEAERRRSEDGRPWEYYYFAPGFFVLEHGTVYRILGRSHLSRNADAVELLTAGLNDLPPHMRGSEWAGEFVYQLGRAHVQAGERAEAANVAEDLDEMARRLGSGWLRGRAAELR